MYKEFTVKKKSFFFAFFILLATLTSLVSCDLSHKHYLDNYGYCMQCQKNQVVSLTRSQDGHYTAEEKSFNPYNDIFYKFVANGENGIQISVSSTSTAKIASILLYTKEDDYIASTYDSENPNLLHQEPLKTGETYYIRVKAREIGTINLTVTPLAE